MMLTTTRALLAVAALACVSAVPVEGVNRALSGQQLATRRWTFNGTRNIATLFVNEPTLCDSSVQQYSGYFALQGSNKKYFYWFFESRNNSATDPTIMWLTGGPGCSSILALLAENGPCSVKPDGLNTETNPYSWNNNANMLYVDQPPGTGFSSGSYDHNEDEVSEDMYQFLQAFFSTYSQYNHSFFVFGESYAGHYVPAISHRVWQGNQEGSGAYIPLKGMSVGNGLTDPQVQYAYYAQMAFNSTTAPQVVSEDVYRRMLSNTPTCVKLISQCQDSTDACNEAFEQCNLDLVSPVQSTGINLYDMRIPCKYGNLCYNFTQVDAFLNNADVQKQLGVSKKWESCNMLVNSFFRADWMHNFQQKVPDMLASGIRVLIYAGDVDYICNWLGNKAWTLKLDWPGQLAFREAKDTPWFAAGKEAGMIRSAQNFTFLQVYEAGHMVPMDQPEASLDMVNAFVTNTLV